MDSEGVNYHRLAVNARERAAIHDLRNLFGVVASAKHLLLRDPSPGRQLLLLDAIEKAAMRGGELATDLLAGLGRPHDLRSVDVGFRLTALLSMMTVVVGPEIGFCLDLPGPKIIARLDPAEFDAAMLELLGNAAAARANRVVIRVRRAGFRLWLLVSDDGCGMSATTLQRVRRAIDTGSSNGVGLYRVHQFLRASHGYWYLRSRPDCGTTVALVLPAAPAVTMAATPSTYSQAQ